MYIYICNICNFYVGGNWECHRYAYVYIATFKPARLFLRSRPAAAEIKPLLSRPAEKSTGVRALECFTREFALLLTLLC